MYCQYCGKRVNDDASFCPSCGAALNSNAGGTVYQTRQQPITVNIVSSNANTNNNTAGGSFYPYKSRWAAFFLCLFLGGIGAHRFYVGKVGTGILWLLTIGLLGIGWLIDLIVILCGGFRDKAGYPLS